MAEKPESSADATQVIGRVEKPVRLAPGEKTVRLTPGASGGRLPGERGVRLAAVRPATRPDAPGERTVVIETPAAAAPAAPPAKGAGSARVTAHVPPAKTAAAAPSTKASAHVPSTVKGRPAPPADKKPPAATDPPAAPDPGETAVIPTPADPTPDAETAVILVPADPTPDAETVVILVPDDPTPDAEAAVIPTPADAGPGAETAVILVPAEAEDEDAVAAPGESPADGEDETEADGGPGPAGDDTVVIDMPPRDVGDDTVVLEVAPPTPSIHSSEKPDEPVGERTVVIPLPPEEEPAPTEPVLAPAAQADTPQAEPVQPEPVQPEPVQPEPVQAEPVQAEPVQAEPVQAEPVYRERVQASSHAEETMVIRMPAMSAAGATTVVMPTVRPVIGDPGLPRLPKAQPRPKTQRPLDALEPERERRTRPRPDGLGRAPWILALSSLGVVLVALGYAGGRYQVPHAMAAYWVGQVVVFTPVVLRLLSRRLAGVAESVVLVLGLAVNQYFLKWCYSPDQFRFPDEMQHWLATTIINDTGELFRPNLALPPAVHFPGLAEMGAGVSQLTGLPVFASGILVAGVAHLCFVGALFALVLRASGSPTIAGVSCAVYSTTLHYLFFNSMYLYQTAALPFFMITIWAVRRWRAGGGRPFLAITVVGIALTTVSHHVTALALVCTLLLLGVTEFVVERGRQWRALIAPAVAGVVVAAWILLVARDVIGYLEAPLDRIMQTASTLVTDHSQTATVAPKVSLWQLAVQGLGLMLLLGLFLALARDTIARRDRDAWRWSILAGTIAFFAGNGVRFLGSNGPEIAGRLSTFTYVPASVVAAIALVQATRLIPRRDTAGRLWLAVSPLPAARPENRTLTVRLLSGATLITVLMVGARVGGWPPASQLLPGPYRPAGFERAVDEYGMSAAAWEYHTLGPGRRVGGDQVSVALASTYGRQDPVREVGSLYYDDVWTRADQQLVDDLAIGYLVVDDRLGRQLPTNQAYFENDPHAGRITEPLTRGQLGKFDSLTHVDRLYDNGTIRIYRVGGTA